MTLEKMNRKTVKYSFDNGRGQRLAGLIDRPENDADVRFYGVFGPCFTCIKESHGSTKICRALAERGVAMLRFDTTGVGESEGVLAETSFSMRIQDMVAAVNAITRDFGAPKILAGHSISGTAILSAHLQVQGIEVLATICSPQDPQHTIDKFRKAGQIEEFADHVVIDVVGRKTTFDASFVDDMLAQKTAEHTALIRQKLLVFHAPNDSIVAFRNAPVIVERAGTYGELVTLADTATHLFERGGEDAAFIADKILENIQ